MRRGHNYIGTEHLLLGILAEDSDTATQLNSLGVTKAFVQQELAVQFARSGRARPAGSRAGELRPGNNGVCPARPGGAAIDTVAAGPVYRPALAISLAARIRSASRNGIAAKLDPNLAEMPCGTHCGSAVNAAREFR